jgi:hypothetical protein
MEADESLCRLLGLPIENEEVQIQKQEIQASIRLEELDAEDSLTIGHLFKDKSETRVSTRIWLAWTVALGAPLYGGVSFLCFFQDPSSNKLTSTSECHRILFQRDIRISRSRHRYDADLDCVPTICCSCWNDVLFLPPSSFWATTASDLGRYWPTYNDGCVHCSIE